MGDYEGKMRNSRNAKSRSISWLFVVTLLLVMVLVLGSCGRESGDSAGDADSQDLIARIESLNGQHTLDYGEDIGLGSKEYRFVELSN